LPDLERVYEAIRREDEARRDLGVYLQNAHLRRVERDDEHEQRLRDAIETAVNAVGEAIAERRRTFQADESQAA
jgi:hypothetical protein